MEKQIMKNSLNLSIIAIAVFGLTGIYSSDQIDDTSSEWISLFNEEDLSGWYTYQREPEPESEVAGIPRDENGNYLEPIGLNKDPLNVFTVVEEDGEPAIRISGETFGILVTNQEYENYHLKLQFKWGDEKYPLTKGKIQLQSEGAEIFYRNIQLRSIDEIPEL